MSRARTVSSLLVLATLATLACACDRSDKTSSTQTSGAREHVATATATTHVEGKPGASAMPTAMTTGAPGTTDTTGATAAASAATAGKVPLAVVTFKEGLSTPESVLYDDVTDMYLVSNVEGQPADADGKAFISRLSPDGKVETLKWIEGGKNKVTLNAPKGLALSGDTLYVADIDTVRMFDRRTGAPTGEVKVPGATFLNDLSVTADGRVLVSDTGTKTKGPGTDAIYAIDKTKKLTTVAKAKDLGNPNGILAIGDKTWVVTQGSGELYSLDAKGKKGDSQKLPMGSLDGILALPNGDIVVSSWDGSVVYRGKPGSDFKPIIENVKSPADIGFDTKRNRLLVPLFTENEVRVFELK